jgi:hypothetical protein
MLFRSSLAIATCFLLSLSAHSKDKEFDWAGQIMGLDGVTIACANANAEKYAAGICTDMMKRIHEKLEVAGIRAALLGSYFVKDEDRPAGPGELNTPMDITVFVRATNSDGVYAINLRNQISVAYENAVEAGSTGDGRKGNLVMWEGSTTGSGPRKQLSAAIVGASFQKLEEQIDAIIKVWSK